MATRIQLDCIILLFGVDSIGNLLLCDRIYGDASSGCLSQAEWRLSQSAGDGVGDEEDSIVTAGIVG